MNDEDFERMNKNLDEQAKVILQSRETALAFLVKAGIATKDGQLAEKYRSDEPSLTHSKS